MFSSCYNHLCLHTFANANTNELLVEGIGIEEKRSIVGYSSYDDDYHDLYSCSMVEHWSKDFNVTLFIHAA